MYMKRGIKRIIIAGATYLVDSVINRGNLEMEADEFKILFLRVVKDAKKKYNFKLWDFVLLDDRFYFLIKPGKGESLSKIMQWIKCNFTKRWNKAHGIPRGHLWGERFHSEIVKNRQEFDWMSGFINMYAAAAQLVKKAKEWLFCGMYHKLKKLAWIVSEPEEGELYFPTQAELDAAYGRAAA
jgi:REP element-mobilizing transposase RayT